MRYPTIDERLTSLERRLAEIERKLGVEPAEVAAVVEPAVAPGDASDNVAAVAVPPPLPVAQAPAWAVPVREAIEDAPPAARAEPLEQTIGLKWAGWIGAVVLTIGAALGIKFAYDQGWLGLMPPAGRLGLMSLGVLALLAAGEVVYRRVSRASAASLFGAGVALAFLVAYAGHGYYDLYGRDVAFALMGGVTLLGAAVAVRGGMVSIAVLALIGGNLVPLILRSPDPRLTPFLAYLLMLQVVALTLSAWGRSNAWHVLRGLSLTTTALWTATLLLAGAGTSFGVMFGFLILSAALFHAEAVWSSWLAERARTGAPTSSAAAAAGFVLATTALLAVGLMAHLAGEPAAIRTGILLALAGVTGAAGVVLARGREEHGARPLRPLAVSYALQAAGLVVAAAPVALSGVWVAVAWGAMAATFAAAGALFDLKSCRRAAVVVWMLAGVQLLLWRGGFFAGGAGGVRPNDPWLTLLGETIPAWAVAAGALALLGHAVAALVGLARFERAREDAHIAQAADGGVLDYARASEGETGYATADAGEPRDLARFADVAAGAIWVLAALAALPPLGATAAVALYAAALLFADRFMAHLRLAPQATAVLVLAAAKWLVLDTVAARLAPGWSPLDRPVLLNAQFGVGLMLVALLAAAWRVLPPREWAARWRAVLVGGAGLCLLWLGTLEIDRAFEGLAETGSAAFRDPGRAKHVAVSIFWSLAAVACVVAGFAVRAAPVRLAGLALLGLTLLKVVLIDLGQVQTGYRVLSFVGLGLLMLGTSVLYGRLAPRLARKV